MGDERPRRAGVSSFGISGTNAHVILEEACRVAPAGAGDLVSVAPVGVGVGLGVWCRGCFRAEVAGVAGSGWAVLDYVEGDDGLAPLDVALSLAGRSVFERRAVVLGGGRGELLEGLRALARGVFVWVC